MNNNLGETEKSGLSTTKGGRARATDPDRGTPSLGNPPPGWATADLAGRLTPLPPALLRRDRDRDRCSRGVRPALLLPFPFPSFSLQPSPSRPVPSRRRCSAVRRRARTPRPAPLLRRPQPLAAEPRCRRLTAVPLTPRLSRRERTARRGAARHGRAAPLLPAPEPRPAALTAAMAPPSESAAAPPPPCPSPSLGRAARREGAAPPPRFPAAPAAPAPAAPAGRHGGAAARRALPLRRGRHPHRPAPGESRRGPLPSIPPSGLRPAWRPSPGAGLWEAPGHGAPRAGLPAGGASSVPPGRASAPGGHGLLLKGSRPRASEPHSVRARRGLRPPPWCPASNLACRLRPKKIEIPPFSLKIRTVLLILIITAK